EQIGTSEFLGYSTLKSHGVVMAIVKDGVSVEQATGGENVGIVLSQTPFYAESGGQTGDSGELLGEGNTAFSVVTTQKPTGGFHVHQGMVKHGTIKVGDSVQAVVNAARRHRLEAHHS